MLRHQKIDISERIEVNKSSASKEFEEHVCNKCHDLLTIAYFLKDIAILNAKGNTYRCILMGISKNEGTCHFSFLISHFLFLISHFSFLIGIMN